MKLHPIALAVLSASVIGTVNAQILEEIVVTADYRNLQSLDTAVSLSIVDAEQLQKFNSTSLEQGISRLSNVNYASGGNNAKYFQIRGIGERSQFIETVNPSIGLVVDGIDVSELGNAAALLDIRSIEVLRGPQGTLHGASTIGGLIYVNSNTASHEESAAQISYASRHFRSAEIATGTKIGDDAAIRIALSRTRADGPYQNEYLGVDDTHHRDETNAKLQANIQLNPIHQLRVTGLWVDHQNGYDAFNFDNNFTTQSDQPGEDSIEGSAFSFQLNSQYDQFTLESSISQVRADTTYAYDEDWSYVGFHPWEYSSYDEYLRTTDKRTGEIRATSSSDTHWVIGVNAGQRDQTLTRNYTYLASPYHSEVNTTHYALFGERVFDLNHQFALRTGTRLEQHNADYQDSDGNMGSHDDLMWGLKLGLEYRLQDQLAFISLSRGFKAGGFNSSTELPEPLKTFSDESLWGIDLGMKGHLAESLSYATTLFYQYRSDAQVKASRLISRTDGSTQFIDFIDNTASANSYGLETELTHQTTESLLSYVNLGLLITQLNEAGASFDGRELAHAPLYSGEVGIDYSINDQWAINLNVAVKDEFYFSNRHDTQSDAYALLNAAISYQTTWGSLRLYGTNLTDEMFATRGFGSFGNNPANGYVTEPYYQLGEPRSVGVSLEVNW